MPASRVAWFSPSAAERSSGDWLDTLLLLAAGALLFGLGIGDYPLWDPGEGRNAQTAREMAGAGRWLVPVLYGVPYYHKPAPFFALLRLFQAVFGESELALRLPSVTASLGTLLLLHRFARPRFGRLAAALAGVIYATSPEVVVLARFCNFDATLSFFVTAAVLAWLAWLDSRAGFPWQAYAAMGFGTLVKGPVAIVLPALVALACAYRRGVLWSSLCAARPLRGALLVAAIVLPWLVPAAIVDAAYVRTFLFRHNVERYLSSDFQHVRSILFYAPVILAGMFPWSLLLPAALRADPRRGRTADLALWAGIVIVFFSIGQAKLATYVLPAFPALALWLAVRLTELAEQPRAQARRLIDGAIALWAGSFGLLPAGLLIFVWVTYPELWPVAAWSLALPLLVWLGMRRMRQAERRPLAVCLVFAAVNVVLLTGFYSRATPFVSDVASDAAIARVARRLAPGVTIFGFRIQPASLAYYSDATVRRTRLLEDIRAAATRGPLLIVTRRKHAAALRAAGIPLYEWLDTRRHLLYATVPVS